MIFKTTQIKGLGRGHEIGFPTINFVVPTNLYMDEGIYAAWIVIEDVTYKGALHYGPIPTFDLNEKMLEVYLLDITDETVPDTLNILIEIDIVEKLRDVKTFETVEELTLEIELDIKRIKSILK